jgi:GT2 family glycosyltransferase
MRDAFLEGPAPVSLDVVICTYNNAALLDRTLAALAKQVVPAGVRWSVLVVDNNCTDDTPAVVDAYAAQGAIPGLRRVAERTQGLTPARLCGVRQTTADWVAFVDDDCLLREDWVAQAAQFARKYPYCGAFGGKVVLDWETPPQKYVTKYGWAYAQQDHGDDVKEVACLVGAGVVLNRQALVQAGWVERQLLADRIGKRLVSGGDVEIALRIRGAGYALLYHPGCVLQHLIPARRTTRPYLLNMTYGLGISQVLADTMLWEGGYGRWLVTAFRQTLQASWVWGRKSLKATLKRKNIPEALIDASFVRGRWAGIRRLLFMATSERQALLGSAARKRSIQPVRVSPGDRQQVRRSSEEGRRA